MLAACHPGTQEGSGSATIDDLFAAARAGELDKVRWLIESGVPVDAGDRYDSTALIMAAGKGHLDVVRYLLDQGADPDHAEIFFGSKPLHSALYEGHVDVAILLLERGANDRADAMEIALARGLPELARAVVASGPLYETRLVELRERDALEKPYVEILAAATSRPDPAPPELTPDELQRFAGRFEGRTSDIRVAVGVEGDALMLALNDEPPRTMRPTADKVFRSDDGVEASFWGRAGSIEGLALRVGDAPPESLRHSVAEPLGVEAFDPDPSDLVADERTVHWPAFRGKAAAGVGDGDDTPTTWDLESGEAVLWSVGLPGLGNSSPVVWNDLVFLTTAVAPGLEQKVETGLTGSGRSVDEAVEHSWRVLAFDKLSGEPVWETEVGRAVPLTKRHFKASQANSTPVTDGRRLVVAFPTAGLAALDLEGNLLWKRELGGLNAGAPGDPTYEWGFASSPVLHGSRAILQVDTHDEAYVAAWDVDSGEQLWRTERDVPPSWASPAIAPGRSGDELVLNGATIRGYDPESGRELWSLGPNSELVIATPVLGDGVIYVSAGYAPIKPIYAVRAGLRGDLDVTPGREYEDLLWSHNRGGAYMPTPLLYRGIFYVVHHNARLVAYDAGSGAAIYKERFSKGGTFTGSPVAVNGKIYAPTEEGLMYVLEAGPEYRELAINEFDEPLMATPAVSEGILLVRTPSKLIAIANR
jgi:outer membrane protein assembly factor BamB